jgi:HlyD family secretion protein
VQQARVAKSEIGILQAETALLKAGTQLARAEANLIQRQAVNQRRQSLVDRGNVTQEAANDARTNEVLARADRDISAAELKVAEGARKDAAAALAIERVTLDQHVLSAPFRARVIARQKEQGSIAGIGEAVFTIIEPSSVWVRGFVDEARAGGIAVGQKAFVRLRSEMNRTVEAEIVRIDSENDRSTEERRLYVRCRTCRPEHQARFLGEQAEIEILQSIVPEGIFVPRRAVEGFDGMSGLVWTIENGALNQRRVGLGDQLRDGRIRIVDRLPEGARAIVTSATSAFSIGRAAKARELAKP